jgi:hypothetical protein
MLLTDESPIPTNNFTYLHCLLSDGWVCIHEAMYHLGEDLVIHCSCLQMSYNQTLAM